MWQNAGDGDHRRKPTDSRRPDRLGPCRTVTGLHLFAEWTRYNDTMWPLSHNHLGMMSLFFADGCHPPLRRRRLTWLPSTYCWCLIIPPHLVFLLKLPSPPLIINSWHTLYPVVQNDTFCALSSPSMSTAPEHMCVGRRFARALTS